MTYVLIAGWTAAPGNEERLEGILRELVAPSAAEPGCLAYRPHRSLEDPLSFVIYEEYEDEDAFRAHSESAHFRELVLGEAIPLLAARSRSFYVPVEA